MNNTLTATNDTTVSKQWANRPDDQRYLDIDSLYAAVKERRDGSREVRTNIHDMAVVLNEDGNDIRLDIPGMKEPAIMTHYSFGGLASRVGAPASYLRELPVELAAECINHGLHKEHEPVMPYLYENGHTTLRADTSPSYGRIYDEQVVSAVQRMIARTGIDWKVPGTLDWGTGTHNADTEVTKQNTTLYASDRDIFLFLVDDRNPIQIGTTPCGTPDMLFRGFYVWNSEVGNATFGIACMYMRAVCQNRILWGVEQKREISFRHTSGAPTRFLQEVRPMLSQFAAGDSQRVIAGVQEAQRPVLPVERKDKIAWIVQHAGVTQSRAVAALNAVEAEEGKICTSVWDIAQGLTAVARRIPHQDQRVDLERVAKKLLDKVV